MASWDKVTAVYMLANRRNGTLYTGVTSNLVRRVGEHRDGHIPGFTKRYGCKHLVWYEVHDLVSQAIYREKSIKSYRRQNKINLIEAENPDWRDLWFDLVR